MVSRMTRQEAQNLAAYASLDNEWGTVGLIPFL